MNKLYKKLTAFFSYTNKRKELLKKKGKKVFVIKGTLKVGVLFLIYYLLFTRLQYSNFNFDHLDFKELFLKILMYLPLSIIIGIIVSVYLWNENVLK